MTEKQESYTLPSVECPRVRSLPPKLPASSGSARSVP